MFVFVVVQVKYSILLLFSEIINMKSFYFVAEKGFLFVCD